MIMWCGFWLIRCIGSLCLISCLQMVGLMMVIFFLLVVLLVIYCVMKVLMVGSYSCGFCLRLNFILLVCCIRVMVWCRQKGRVCLQWLIRQIGVFGFNLVCNVGMQFIFVEQWFCGLWFSISSWLVMKVVVVSVVMVQFLCWCVRWMVVMLLMKKIRVVVYRQGMWVFISGSEQVFLVSEGMCGMKVSVIVEGRVISELVQVSVLQFVLFRQQVISSVSVGKIGRMQEGSFEFEMLKNMKMNIVYISSSCLGWKCLLFRLLQLVVLCCLWVFFYRFWKNMFSQGMMFSIRMGMK